MAARKKKSGSRRPVAKKKAAKTRKPRIAAKKASKAPKRRGPAKKAVRPAKKRVIAKKKPAAAPRTAMAPPAPTRPPVPAAAPVAVTELDNRIAIVRANLRDLVDQAASSAGAANEELLSQRIAEQEERLRRLRQERDQIPEEPE